MAAEKQPEIQLIANLVVQRPDGKVLLVRYDAEDERWWLPGEDLDPYQHPDERARQILDELPGLEAEHPKMIFIESFRGRRGWHVVFHYRVRGDGQPAGTAAAEWFAPDELPRTMHGRWERDAVRRALEDSAHVDGT
jgi:ADP-ribose pyrophosphatase YjhB (NUDIX family)